MKKPVFRTLTAFLLIVFLAGCAPAAITPSPTRPGDESSEISQSLPAASSTPAPPAATITSLPPSVTPYPTATETVVPSPTVLPGRQVLPLDSLGDSIPWLPTDPDQWPGVHYIGFNTRFPPFDNALVRRAFAQAVDRDVLALLATKYKYKNVTPATNLTPPLALGRDLYGEVGLVFDPEQAKALLVEAGYTDISTFPPVTLLVSYQGEISPGSRHNMGLALAEMWQTHLGIKVDVLTVSRAEYLDRIHNNPSDLYWIGWLADYVDPDNFLRQLFRTGSDTNYGQFSNSTFDDLVDHAERTAIVDPAGRQALYIEAERLLCEEKAGVIPLFHVTR